MFIFFIFGLFLVFLIVFVNFILQLKLVIYDIFYFGPYSFNFFLKLHCILKKNPFIFFDIKVLIC